MQASQPPPQEQ
jgi:hypothetical protein